MTTPQRYRCHPCGHEWDEPQSAKVKSCPVCKSQDFIRMENDPPKESAGPGRHGRGGRQSSHPDGE